MAKKTRAVARYKANKKCKHLASKVQWRTTVNALAYDESVSPTPPRFNNGARIVVRKWCTACQDLVSLGKADEPELDLIVGEELACDLGLAEGRAIFVSIDKYAPGFCIDDDDGLPWRLRSEGGVYFIEKRSWRLRPEGGVEFI